MLLPKSITSLYGCRWAFAHPGGRPGDEHTPDAAQRRAADCQLHGPRQLARHPNPACRVPDLPRAERWVTPSELDPNQYRGRPRGRRSSDIDACTRRRDASLRRP